MHFLEPYLYELACLMIDHFIWYSRFSNFSHQMYLESSVSEGLQVVAVTMLEVICCHADVPFR